MNLKPTAIGVRERTGGAILIGALEGTGVVVLREEVLRIDGPANRSRHGGTSVQSTTNNSNWTRRSIVVQGRRSDHQEKTGNNQRTIAIPEHDITGLEKPSPL